MAIRRHISGVRCSRACCWHVNRTSGSASSVPTLSLIFSSHRSRFSKLLPMDDSEAMPGWSATILRSSAVYSA